MSNQTPNHTCIVCGEKYFACDDCDRKFGKSWRAVCCSPLHYQIHMIVVGLKDGSLSQEEVKTFCKHLEITDEIIQSLKPSIQNILLNL